MSERERENEKKEDEISLQYEAGRWQTQIDPWNNVSLPTTLFLL